MPELPDVAAYLGALERRILKENWPRTLEELEGRGLGGRS
jgi:hypothetical protein